MEGELLRDLARHCCDSFLGVQDKDGTPLERIIGVYGAEEKVLNQFKSYIEDYFQKKGEAIQVSLKRQGYEIHVGDLIQMKSPQ